MSNPVITAKVALSAGAFVDSIGINVHLAYTNSEYTNVTQVGSALNYLGVENVRDNLSTSTLAVNGFEALAAAGIKFDFLPTLNANSTVDVTAFVNNLIAYEAKFPGSIVAIEGANEVNGWMINENGVTSIASGALLQEQLYTAVKASASLADIPVFNTTIGSGTASMFAQLGDLSSYTDYANSHPYVMSTSNISGSLTALMALAESNAPGKPLVITEAGYNTLTSNWYNGVSQTVQAKYTLDTLMDAYQKGVSSTYLYELFDENLGTSNNQSYYGLFNADGTPKAAATAVHNMTAILSDPGGTAGNVTGSLSFALTGMPTSGQDMVLAKHNGAMDLVIWAEPVLWNQTTATAITAPASSVTVTFAGVEGEVEVFDPLAGTMPIATYFNVSQIQLSVTDHPLIIEINSAETVTSDIKTFTDAVVTGETKTYAVGFTDLTDTKVYNTAGVLTRDTIVHTDGTKDIYLSAITSQNYVSEHDSYNSAGVLTSQTRMHTDGTLASSYVLGADGSKTTNTYDSLGVLKSTVILYANGTTDTKTYTGAVLTGETVKYASGSAEVSDVKVFNAAGVQTQETVVHTNGSQDVYLSAIAGRTYVSEHNTYNSTGSLTAQVRLHGDGSLASTYSLASDGTTTINTHDASGVLTSDVVSHANGSSESKTYTGAALTGDKVIFAPGSATVSDVKVYSVAGVLTLETLAQSNGSKITDTYDTFGVHKTDITSHADASYDSKTYTGTVLTGETVKYAAGSANLYDTKVFNLAGVQTQETVFHADGSQDLYLSAIAGRTYASEHDVYDSTGILTAQTRLHADGSLASTYTLDSDGTKTANTYDASGVLLSDVVTRADGSSDTKSYSGNVLTSETLRYASGAADSKTYAGAVLNGEAVKYAPGSTDLSDTRVFNVAGVLINDTVVHAGGSKDIYISAISGRTYVSEHDTYSSSGILTSQIRLHADGSLAATYTLASDGSTTVDSYDASGLLTSDIVSHADGASEKKTYTGSVLTGDKIIYAPGAADLSDAKVFSVAGVLTLETLAQSNGTKITDTYDAFGVLKTEVVSHLDGSYDSKTYIGTILTGETVKHATGSADLTDTKIFDATGLLTSDTIVHANGSQDVYLSAISNRAYVSEHDVYSGAGALTAQTRSHSDGSLASTYTLGSDGTKTTDTYDASGVLQKDVVTHTDGSSDIKTYTGTVLTAETVKYAGSAADISDSKTYNTAGALTNDTVVHADHSKDVYDTNLTGQSYVADHFVYNTAGALQSGDLTNANGSHAQTAYAAGVTLNAAPAVSDTFNTYAGGGDTFNFKAGFGNDTVNGFHAGAAANHDTLAIDVSEAADFQHLQLQSVGHDTLITLSANDSILLKGVAATSLSVQDFHFVHYDLHL
jgi:hypothetical protein